MIHVTVTVSVSVTVTVTMTAAVHITHAKPLSKIYMFHKTWFTNDEEVSGTPLY